MEVIEIKTKKKYEKVNRIFHIADVHIRLFKRTDEYQHVFDNLYTQLKSQVKKDDIIVVAGDIVHSKTEMSPEMVNMTSLFLKNLADITDTIIIAGNHDANLNNIKRMDAIYPIVQTLKHKSLHYLRDTGLYQLSNVMFSVMGIFESYSKYIKAEDISDEFIKIAMYHGPLQGSTTDTGYKITSDKIDVNLFHGYDIVLLGDIHKRQVLQEYSVIKNPYLTEATGSMFEKLNEKYGTNYGSNIKLPAIEYPGSLIQQNFGESLKNHGYLVWNIEERKSEFYEVHNDYGYVTLNAEYGELIEPEIELPSKPRVRLKTLETNPTQLKRLVSKIRTRWNPLEIVINRINTSLNSAESENKIDLSNIREVDFQNNLIEDFLKFNFNIDDETMRTIFDINKKLNERLPVQDIIRNVTWKPKIFRFSNMFSYGEDNIINFSKLGGIVGLFSANASGKTSVLEAFTFCLFDRCSKAFKASHILNNRKKSFWCDLTFELNGKEYYIKRYAKRTATGNVPVKVDFYRVEGDDMISLNGEQRRDTDSVIRSYIGSYEDFLLTAVSSQTSPSNFIDMSKTEKKDLLAQFMDITIFDQLYEMGSEHVKEFEILIKQYDNRNLYLELDEYRSKLKSAKAEYKVVELNKKTLDKNKKELQDEVLNLSKQLIQIDDSIIDIDFLEQQKIDLEESLVGIKKKYYELEKGLNLELDAYSKKQKKYESYDIEDINKKMSELKELNTEYKKLCSEIEEFKIHIQHKIEKVDKLSQVEYDPDCKYCMNNILVKDAIQAKKELENDKEQADRMMSKKKSFLSKIESYGELEKEYNELLDIKSELDSMKMELLSKKNKYVELENKINNHKSEISKINDNIDKHYKSEKDIEYNLKIEEQISHVKSKILEINKDIDREENLLREKYNLVKSYETKKDEVNEIIQKVEDMEEKHSCYQYYLEAIKRDSIPYELISKAIPVVEHEINNILNQVVDFGVMLDLEGKNINAKIVYDENKVWPLEMASGMERFITGMAIRTSLINVSNLPRPNFIAIDEGFSTLDADNSSNLPIMFDYLKSQMDFVFIISHMDYIRDFVDVSLDLKKENDFSKITLK